MRKVTAEQARIASNLLRMLLTLFIGLMTVRLFLGAGPDAYALYLLIVVGVGVTVLSREFLRVGLIAFLGEAYMRRETEPRVVREAFGTAFIVAALAALVSVLILLWTLVSLESLGVDPRAVEAGRYFVALRVVFAAVSVAGYPFLAALLVSRRQVHLNIVLFLERVVDLVAIALAVAMAGEGAELDVIRHFGEISLILGALLMSAAAFGVMRLGPEFRPLLPPDPVRAVRSLRKALGVAFLDITGPFLYMRFDMLILSVFYGATGAILVGLSFQLVSYIRQVAIALVAGLDAVFAQVNFGQLDAGSKTAARAAILRRSAALQSAIVFYFIAFLILFLTDIIDLWLGDRLVEAGGTNAGLATLVLVMLPGMMAISLSENWTMTMTGGGYLTRFIGVILSVAVINPVLVLAILYGLDMGRDMNIVLVAAVFSVLHVLCYLILLPQRASRILDIPLSALFTPMIATLAMASGAIVLALSVRMAVPQGVVMLTDLAVLAGCFLLTARFYLLPLMREASARVGVDA